MAQPDGFTERMQLAFDLHRRGEVERVEPIYRELLPSRPNDFDLLHLLGLICFQTGRYQEADELMARALSVNPRSSDAESNHGLVLLKLHRTEEAMKRFKGAVRHDPKSLAAIANYAIGLIAAGQLDDALQWLDRHIAMHPKSVELHYVRADALRAMKRFAEAATAFERVIQSDSKRVDAIVGLAACRLASGDAAEASLLLQHALAIDPAKVDALELQADMLAAAHNWEDALALAEKASTASPESVALHLKRSQMLGRLERYEDALSAAERALEIHPGHAEALFHRGIALEALFDFEGALEAYQAILASDPGHAAAHWNEAYCQLMLGRLSEGFRNYEWRWKTPFLNKKPRFTEPLWLGDADIAGKRLLLHSEQGFGDTFQFLRYVKQVDALGADVLLEVPPAVVPLIASLFGADRVFATDSALPTFEFQCPLPSLPLALGTGDKSVPNETPYLFADPFIVDQWRERLGKATGMRIGVVWSGNPGHVNDANRSIPLNQFLDAFPSGVQLIALQKEFRATDELLLKRKSALTVVADQLNSFADTAAIIELCDLVVSIDTGVAHLAAAMNKPTWILADMVSDWRWQRDRVDSPWYPSVKLYRQTTRQRWSPVLMQVRDDIKALLPRKGIFSIFAR
jgi:tetratricopeptide (TPR) repeat protein